MNIEEIKKQITTAIKKAKQEQKRYQTECDKDADMIKSFKSREQLLKNHKLKLELIKRELEKEKSNFELSIHVAKNLRIKAFKKIRGIQIEAHLENGAGYGNTPEQVRKKYINDEFNMNFARKRLLQNLEAKFSENNIEKEVDREIRKLDITPDGDLFFDTDVTGYWYDYDYEIEKRVKDPKLREDNIVEFHGVIRRNMNKDLESFKNNLKALTELKSQFDDAESRLLEKTKELKELHNQLKYLNQIENQYIHKDSK